MNESPSSDTITYKTSPNWNLKTDDTCRNETQGKKQNKTKTKTKKRKRRRRSKPHRLLQMPLLQLQHAKQAVGRQAGEMM